MYRSRRGFLNLLLELRRQRELALVLISHDLAVIRYMTEEALVVEEGQVVERGSTYQLLEAPAHPVHSVAGRVDSGLGGSDASRHT